MQDRLRRRWIAEEVLQLGLAFGEVNVDEVAGDWVMLPRFPLMPGLGRPYTAVLIELPPAYPAVPPNGVFIDRKLPVKQHYYPESERNPYAELGWAWLCLHERSHSPTWRPGRSPTEGDNLLIVLALVTVLLAA